MFILLKTFVIASRFHLYLPLHILCFFQVTTAAKSLKEPLRAWEILIFLKFHTQVSHIRGTMFYLLSKSAT